jgi:dephospho-CoA kinase
LTGRLFVARLSGMQIIGLTGGIGSGKSTVAGFLAELGATVIDADQVGHEILDSDEPARWQVADAFGDDVVGANGTINRKKLGDVVFASPKALKQLNGIMHPKIDTAVLDRLQHYRQQGVKVVVIEAPLLVEAGWAGKVDHVWLTVAPQEVVLKRLEALGIPRAKALARIDAQLTDEERRRHAEAAIDTDCSLEELRRKVDRLWRGLQVDI